MVYAISDIHGCYNTFNEMLKLIKFDSNDTLICLGDCIDRGVYGFEMLDYFMQHDNVILLKGNHEYFFECYLKGMLSTKDWCNFGGKYMLQDIILKTPDEIEKYYNFICKLPLYYQYKDFILSHNGFNADLPFIKNNDCEIIVSKTIDAQWSWGPYEFIISSDIHFMPKFKTDKKMIVGHYPTFRLNGSMIYKSDKYIDIDCGATFKGGQLSCLCLDTFEEFYTKIDENDICVSSGR